jgi:ParB-like chromosome segregation protein Spo0J
MTDHSPKARTLANGIEVWCSFDKLVPVGELKPNPRNPNTHPQRQIELLAKNIRYFGWRQNICVSRLTGLVVAGHGRLMAAKHLGVEVVPVQYQDFSSENDELAVLVADNRLAELSTVDLNELEKIASEWKSIDFDTILAGFEPADIEGLLNPGGNDDEEDDDDRHDKELDKSDVTVAVGLYRFRITQEDFIAWCDRVKQDAGFDKESVLNEIRNRLGL